MKRKSDITKGAVEFANTLLIADGRTSVDFAVSQHLEWFRSALDRGLSWAHIISLLHKAGVSRADGLPLSRGHLTAVYSRQLKRAAKVERPD